MKHSLQVTLQYKTHSSHGTFVCMTLSKQCSSHQISTDHAAIEASGIDVRHIRLHDPNKFLAATCLTLCKIQPILCLCLKVKNIASLTGQFVPAVQLIPIMRAGLVLLDQASSTLPMSETYHVGLERDERTLRVRHAT